MADALEGLLSLEKAQRLAENLRATKMCCQAVLEVCHAAKDWKLLNEHVVLLAKRRSQLKQVRWQERQGTSAGWWLGLRAGRLAGSRVAGGCQGGGGGPDI